VTCYVFQCILWWVYAFGGEFWIFDVAGWDKHLEPVPELDLDRPHVLPYYVFYLGYAFHSLVKDVRRCAGNFNSAMQAMFLFHHVLTIFLVTLSIEYRCWRAGVLTRLLFGPADVGVYAGKVMIAAHDKGLVSKTVMGTTYFCVTCMWFVLRVFGYFFVIYTLHTIYIAKGDQFEINLWRVSTALLYGSWTMWTLQVIWAVYLVGPTYRFLRYGGRGYDAIDAGQDVTKEIAKAKGVDADVSSEDEVEKKRQ